MSYVLHRWEYQTYMRYYKCVPLPFGGVESYQWCIGCGAIVTDRQLISRNMSRDKAFLDMMTDYAPIEAGTLAEFWFRKKGIMPQYPRRESK